MKRREFLQATAAMIAAGHVAGWRGVCAQDAPGQGIRRPNIILIVADDLGYGDLACYGHPRNKTPHLDQLAQEGLKFTDFHANGPMCSPTRAALLTGQYQNRFGRKFESALSAQDPTGLPPDTVTVADLLKQAGYATAMYGKWHLGYAPPQTPPHFGFDDFRGLLTGDGDHHSQISRSGSKDWYHNDAIEMEEGYTTDLITKHSIDFMRKHRDQPFFIYMAHLAIHFPWQAPGEAAQRVEGTDYWSLEKLGPHPEGEVGPVVQAMVESLDKSVGEIVDAVRELGLDDNTLIYFTSDNGGYVHYGNQFHGEISSNDPLRGQKTEVWEGGHRVPAIAWWPGRIAPGTTTHATTMTMDLLPTCAELAGVDVPKHVDGVTLAPLLLHETPLPQRDLFWRAGDAWAVRRGPWKLVDGGDGKVHLFNLDADIEESEDVSAQNPEVVKELRAAFEKWEQDVDASAARRT
jgi:arylsulfatase A